MLSEIFSLLPQRFCRGKPRIVHRFGSKLNGSEIGAPRDDVAICRMSDVIYTDTPYGTNQPENIIKTHFNYYLASLSCASDSASSDNFMCLQLFTYLLT